ncbi:MAG: hypothetical protein ACHQ53_01395 [Polyangiales bacterium]
MPGPKYVEQLRFAELLPRAPLPRPATLRRMRHGLKEGFTLALRAPQSTLCSASGPLRFDAALEQAFGWLLQARDALAAKLLVLPTPAEVTPGARDRERLADLSARIPREPGQHVVWIPNGPWEPDDAAELAASLGFVLGFDPLLQPMPDGPVAYARLLALGAQQRFSDSILERVNGLLTETPDLESFVAVDAPRSFDYAVRLQKLADAAHDAA